jgi:hypothetical protein
MMKNDAKNSVNKGTSSYLRFSGLAFQMLGVITVFTYLGYKLDEWQDNAIPVCTLVLSLSSIAASLYLFIRNVTK